MGTISLLILAAVAGFLFYQLRAVLGQTPDQTQKKPQDKNNDLKDYFNRKKEPAQAEIIKLSVDHGHRFIKSDINIDKTEITETLNEIKSYYTDFDVNQFIDGAKKAYEMILESFNQDLPLDIQEFISGDLYNGYRKLLDDYKAKNYSYETAVTRINQAVIVFVECDAQLARIKVELQAQNISILKDQDGQIIQGSSDDVMTVTDIWTFERAHNALTPAWIVTAV